MNTIERLSRVKEILSSSKRVVFPLINPSTGTFSGLILTRNIIFCLTHAPTYGTFAEAQEQTAQVDHNEAIRDAQAKHKGDWHNDKKDYSSTITRGAREIEDLWINLTPYMDAGCMTARPQTPAKRLAALFRRVGLSHLCITDKNNVFRGLITRRSLITPPGTAQPAEHGHGHGAAAAQPGRSETAVTHHATISSRKGSHAHHHQPSVQSIAEGEEQEDSKQGRGGFSFADDSKTQ